MSFTPTCPKCSKPLIYQPSAVQYYCPACHLYRTVAEVRGERKFA